MKITVRVKPGCRQEKVEVSSDGSLQVWVRAKAQEGKANEAVVAALARHYDVAKSRITILKGASGRSKLVEIL